MKTPSLKRFSKNDLTSAKAHFEEFGYTIVHDFDLKQTLIEFKVELKGIIESYLHKAGIQLNLTGDALFSEGIAALENKDHEYVAAVYDTIFQTPSFLRIVGDREITDTTRALLGLSQQTPLYGYTNRCRIDPPRDDRRTYGWHQEVFYTIPRSKYLQTWAPLIFDTTTQNGTIEVAAGSHLNGIAPQKWIEEPGRATQILVDDSFVSAYPQGPVEMKVGEILFFSGYLAHRSGSNTSQQVRYSLVGMFHDVAYKEFNAPKLAFHYRSGEPRDYYNSTFNTR